LLEYNSKEVKNYRLNSGIFDIDKEYLEFSNVDKIYNKTWI
jgi:hypothetical protein